MSRQEYNPCCAICRGPGEPDCNCEGDKLRIAIDQAEKRWIESWMADTRDWVTRKSVSHITTLFDQLKTRRLQNHQFTLQQLPYYHMFVEYRGRPPLHPHLVADVQRQMHQADIDLRRGIDSDWKSCVIRYPDVLAHYFGLVGMRVPGEGEVVSQPVLAGLSTIDSGLVGSVPGGFTMPQPLSLTQHAHPPTVIGSVYGEASHPPKLTRSATGPPRRIAPYAPPEAPTAPSRPKTKRSTTNQSAAGGLDPSQLSAALFDLGKTSPLKQKTNTKKVRQSQQLDPAEIAAAMLLQMNLAAQGGNAAPPQRANSVKGRKRRDSGQFYPGVPNAPKGLAGMGAGQADSWGYAGGRRGSYIDPEHWGN